MSERISREEQLALARELQLTYVSSGSHRGENAPAARRGRGGPVAAQALPAMRGRGGISSGPVITSFNPGSMGPGSFASSVSSRPSALGRQIPSAPSTEASTPPPLNVTRANSAGPKVQPASQAVKTPPSVEMTKPATNQGLSSKLGAKPAPPSVPSGETNMGSGYQMPTGASFASSLVPSCENLKATPSQGISMPVPVASPAPSPDNSHVPTRTGQVVHMPPSPVSANSSLVSSPRLRSSVWSNKGPACMTDIEKAEVERFFRSTSPTKRGAVIYYQEEDKNNSSGHHEHKMEIDTDKNHNGIKSFSPVLAQAGNFRSGSLSPSAAPFIPRQPVDTFHAPEEPEPMQGIEPQQVLELKPSAEPKKTFGPQQTSEPLQGFTSKQTFHGKQGSDLKPSAVAKPLERVQTFKLSQGLRSEQGFEPQQGLQPKKNLDPKEGNEPKQSFRPEENWQKSKVLNEEKAPQTDEEWPEWGPSVDDKGQEDTSVAKDKAQDAKKTDDDWKPVIMYYW